METYNYGILLSNSLKNIYEIFTEESFQILLDMDPNDSKREIDVFVQLLDSTESEFYSKMQGLEDTILENEQMIKEKIDQIKVYMKIYNDNEELNAFQEDLELCIETNMWFNTIYFQIRAMGFSERPS